MLPIIHIFNISLDSGIFFWGVGILFAGIYYQYSAKDAGYHWYQSLLFGVCFLFFEIIGAKALYVIENYQTVKAEGLTFTGFSFFGIMASVPLFNYLLAKGRKTSYAKLMDFSSAGILIQLAFYRIGCTCAGCCHGIVCSIGILNRDGNRYFPVQPIEAALDLSLAIVLIHQKENGKLKDGEQYLLYMTGYGLIRFVLEFLRVRQSFFGVFSLSHLWALACLLTGGAILVCKRSLHKQ